MHVFQYCRRSNRDESEKQILSIPAQKEENARLIERQGHRLIAAFEESRSAKTPGRPVFNEMLDRIEAGEAEAIVCWKLNRLARNPIDAGRAQWMLQQGVLKAIVTPEKTYLPSDNVLQMCLEMGMATQFSIDLGKDVKRGMMQKVKMGWKPGVPPVGYLPDYGGIKGERRIFKDPERFAVMRQCWDLLLSQTKTVGQIWEIATKEWKLTRLAGRGKAPVPVGLSTLYKLFSNPFFCGEFEWDGETWQGLHEPMVTRKEFDRVQAILGRKGRPRPQKHESPYSGLIHCGECGSMIVLDPKRKFLKSENRVTEYRYYRCSKRRKGTCCTQRGCIREEDLERQLTEIVAKVALPQSIIEWSLKKLRLSLDDIKARRKAQLRKLQGSYDDIVERIGTLMDRQLSQTTIVPEDLFQEKLGQLRQEKDRAKRLILDFDASVDQETEDLVDHLQFTGALEQKFSLGSRDFRLASLHQLGQRFELKDGTLGFRFAEPYGAFSRGKARLQEAVGSLRPLECGLKKVESSLLEKATLVWCSVLEEVRTSMGLSGMDRHCKIIVG